MSRKHEAVRFNLVNTALNKKFGVMSLNGKFVFELDASIEPEIWQQIGIIPLHSGERKVEVKDLFFYLNSRLPQNLRAESNEKKLEYITNTGLRVASDNFVLRPV